jgi:hypothetical protein
MKVDGDPVGGIPQRDQNDAGQEEIKKPDFRFLLDQGTPFPKRALRHP